MASKSNLDDSAHASEPSRTPEHSALRETKKTQHDAMKCFINSLKNYDVGLTVATKFDGTVYCDTKHTNTFTLINSIR